jgi:hypothetical protein
MLEQFTGGVATIGVECWACQYSWSVVLGGAGVVRLAGVERASSDAPLGVSVGAAYTGGEPRVQIRFDHGTFVHVEAMTLPQAAALSVALRESVKR